MATIGQTASIVLPAADPSVRHFCTGFTFSITLAPNASVGFYLVQVIDGATSKFAKSLNLSPTTGTDIATDEYTSSNLYIGSPGTSMTFAFVNPLPAGTIAQEQFIECTGYDL